MMDAFLVKSNKPSIVIITPKNLDERIDAAYYEAEHLLRDKGVKAYSDTNTIDELFSVTKLSGFEFTEYFTHKELSEGTILCLMSHNVGENLLDLSECIKITDETHTLLQRSQLENLDIVLSYTGHYRRAAVVPYRTEPLHLGPNVCKLQPKVGHLDSYFYSTYFNSCYGQHALDREKTIAAQPTVNMSRIRSIVVPLPHPDAQAYIGNKVRQAEALRAKARVLIEEATKFFQEVYSKRNDGWNGAWRSKHHTLGEERLDAWFYAPAPTQLIEKLAARNADNLSQYLTLVKQNTFNPNQPICYFEIGNLDTSTGCIWPTRVEPKDIPSRAQRSVMCWDILVSTVRPERKNVAVVGSGNTGQLVASSGFSVLRASSPEDAAFYCWFLRSDAGTDQLLRWNTGSTYPAIDDDVPMRMLVPRYEVEIRKHFGCRWMLIPGLQFFSSRLVSAARFLVEALIERKVTEADLIAAHNDPTVDRGLMQRLTVDGLDVPGAAPLFDDLDRLQTLLAEISAPEGGFDEL